MLAPNHLQRLPPMKRTAMLLGIAAVALFSVVAWAGLFSGLPKARLTIKVVDEDGSAVSNMPVRVHLAYDNANSGR